MIETFVKVVGFLTTAVLISFLLSYPLMILWNECLIPAVPGLKEVEWLQMWGINLLIGSMCKSTK